MSTYADRLLHLVRSIDRNTKCNNCGDPIITSAGLNSSIPAGFNSVSIVKTSTNLNTVTITLSDGSTYVLTEQGEGFSDSVITSRPLPGYTIVGPGTWKWHGIQ